MSSNKKVITILGATGSIGKSTADIILAHPDKFEVYAITAHQNVDDLAELAIKLEAKVAVIGDHSKTQLLAEKLSGTSIEALGGQDALESVASKPVDLVMAAIMGFAGLKPIVNALEQGTNVAIANKEPLVAAGQYITQLAQKNGAKLLPVDSEHNAIFQVFENQNRDSIDKIILTASGGPFLNSSLQEMETATLKDALAHPNWVMGQKISIDSATMMNKALEIIEASHLFDLPGDKIDVVIHPQSTIHSMVSYKDGSILSQMGASDMRTPIAYALGWPERIESSGDTLDIKELSQLTFEQPDFEKFPALRYAYECMELGQAACITLNAANEIAVDLFLKEHIRFTDIMSIVSDALETIYPKITNMPLKTIEDIIELDKTVRSEVSERVKQRNAA